MSPDEDPPFPEPPSVQPTRELLLAQALDACIRAERRIPGSSERIIARQPDWAREDLRRMVGLAGSLDAVATNAIISEDFREAARARLMQRISASRPSAVALPAGQLESEPPGGRLTSFPSLAASTNGHRSDAQSIPRPRRRVSRWLWRCSASLVAAVVAVLASLTASASSLPGEPLYGLKQAQEELGVRLAADDQARALALLRRADARLDETGRLLQLGRTDEAQATTDQYGEVIAQATTYVVQVEGVESDVSAGIHIDSKLSQQQEHLEVLMQSAPEPARATLREALVTAERSRALVADPGPDDRAMERGNRRRSPPAVVADQARELTESAAGAVTALAPDTQEPPMLAVVSRTSRLALATDGSGSAAAAAPEEPAADASQGLDAGAADVASATAVASDTVAQGDASTPAAADDGVRGLEASPEHAVMEADRTDAVLGRSGEVPVERRRASGAAVSTSESSAPAGSVGAAAASGPARSGGPAGPGGSGGPAKVSTRGEAVVVRPPVVGVVGGSRAELVEAPAPAAIVTQSAEPALADEHQAFDGGAQEAVHGEDPPRAAVAPVDEVVASDDSLSARAGRGEGARSAADQVARTAPPEQIARLSVGQAARASAESAARPSADPSARSSSLASGEQGARSSADPSGVASADQVAQLPAGQEVQASIEATARSASAEQRGRAASDQPARSAPEQQGQGRPSPTQQATAAGQGASTRSAESNTRGSADSRASPTTTASTTSSRDSGNRAGRTADGQTAQTSPPANDTARPSSGDTPKQARPAGADQSHAAPSKDTTDVPARGTGDRSSSQGGEKTTSASSAAPPNGSPPRDHDKSGDHSSSASDK